MNLPSSQSLDFLTIESKAKTVEGDDIKVKVKNGGVMINDANVVIADVAASNGVVNVIDTVILPPEN